MIKEIAFNPQCCIALRKCKYIFAFYMTGCRPSTAVGLTLFSRYIKVKRKTWTAYLSLEPFCMDDRMRLSCMGNAMDTDFPTTQETKTNTSQAFGQVCPEHLNFSPEWFRCNLPLDNECTHDMLLLSLEIWFDEIWYDLPWYISTFTLTIYIEQYKAILPTVTNCLPDDKMLRIFSWMQMPTYLWVAYGQIKSNDNGRLGILK